MSLLFTALLCVISCFARAEAQTSVIGLTGVHHQNPTFSPDGKRILFVSNLAGNYAIFVSRPDGTEMKNLTNHPSDNGGPVWSPDGRFIVFSSDRDGQIELYRMKPDGTGLVNLTQNPADDTGVQFSSDGKKIVFYRGTPVYVTPTPEQLALAKRLGLKEKLLSDYKNPHLVVASDDGSNQRVLVQGGEMPRWSPDGQWILYRSRSNEIRIIRPDGSGARKVIDGTPIAWTPDSKAIFYSPSRQGIDKPAHIYLVNIDGTENKKCLENVAASGYWFHVDSRRFWDSSGSRIALAVHRLIGRQDNNGIVVLNRQGQMIADYREQGKPFDYGDQVSWSRNGKTILFSKWGSDYRLPYEGGIYTMKDDGTETRLIIADKAGWKSH